MNKSKELLTKLEVIDIRVTKASVETAKPLRGAKGHVMLNSSFKTIAQDDERALCVDCEVALRATQSESTEPAESDKSVVDLNLKIEFTFASDEPLDENEINDHFWIIESILKPLTAGIIKDYLKRTPLGDVPESMFVKFD